MYRSVLAALLIGMLPLPTALPLQQPLVALQEIAIAPLVPPLEIDGHLSASGVLVADLQGGQNLFSRQAGVKRPMASLTKLMTALLIAENHSMDEWVTVPAGARKVNGNSAYLPVGEQFTVRDLLAALLIASANDAAYVLATFHSGSVDKFVEEMNLRTEALGLKDTLFENPTGLDSKAQWSTPQDMVWLATFVLRVPIIRKYMGKRGMPIYSRQGRQVDLVHTHALLHADTSVKAGKTGTTNAAKECLLSLVEVNGREYVVVLMYSLQRYKDMRIILNSIEGKPKVS